MSYARFLAAAGVSLCVYAPLAANAGPVSPNSVLGTNSTSTAIAQVQYRADYDDDGGILDVPGDVVGGVVGGVLGDGWDGGYGGRGAMAACARSFRSFDPSTGTYTTYSGEQVLCPYLRG